jgi:thymidine kinase
MTIGTLKVYAGPMYSGKTTSLIGEITIALDNRRRPLVIKPIIDNRYGENDIVTHDGVSLYKMTDIKVLKLPVGDIPQIDQVSNIDILLIDEAQFFTNIGNAIDAYLEMGIDVVAVGLDMDSNGKPFGSMPALMAKANKVHKLTAHCSVCGDNATRTYRKPDAAKDQVLIGGTETYEPRCLEHWSPRKSSIAPAA